jgi:hypothetical protein
MLKYLLAYRYAVAAGLTGWLALLLMQRYPKWWLFLLFFLLWAGGLIVFFKLTQRKAKIDRNDLVMVGVTALAFAGLTSLVEWVVLRQFLNIFCGVIISILYIMPIHREYAAHHELKPWRRRLAMVWVFDAYALATVLFALGVFFVRIPTLVFALLGALIYSFAALKIWQMYFQGAVSQFALWTLVTSLIMFEIIWVFFFLPLGHLVLGLLATWLWYLLQLLVRFHLTGEGVVWRKQAWFLGINAVLFVAMLVFVVRWI